MIMNVSIFRFIGGIGGGLALSALAGLSPAATAAGPAYAMMDLGTLAGDANSEGLGLSLIHI